MSAPIVFGDAAVSSLAAGVNPLDATSVIAATGVIGILCVLIAETGLLVGFFLPGDWLLFTAGILAASHGALHLPLGWVLLAATAGALIGAQIGYWIGRTLGIRLLERAQRPALRRGVEPGQRSGVSIRPRQGHRAVAVHPDRAHRDEPDGRDDADTGRRVHTVADRRRSDLVPRRDPGRLLARVEDHRDRHLPAADHRPGGGSVADPGGARVPPDATGPSRRNLRDRKRCGRAEQSDAS